LLSNDIDLRGVELPLHCTVYYDETGQDFEYSDRVHEDCPATRTLMTTNLWIGKEGAAIEVELTAKGRELMKHREGLTPHVSMAVSKGHSAGELGGMVTKLRCAPEPAERGSGTRNPSQALRRGNGWKVCLPDQILTCVLERYEMNSERPRCQAGRETETEERLQEVPVELWTRHPNDVGRVLAATPVSIRVKEGVPLPRVAQYPLRQEAIEGIAPVLAALRDQGVIIPTKSQCNTPILPVKKPGGDKWRFVQDLRAVNKCVKASFPVVPHPVTVLSGVPPTATHFSVVDLCSAFFSIPLAEDSQHLFAFSYNGQQYTWTVLPQGFCDSPTLFSQALKEDLEDIELPEGSVMIQYVDDLLVCSDSQTKCETDTVALLTALARKGHKVSKEKLQFSQPRVTYLGHILEQGQRSLGPERVETILEHPKPTTLRLLRRFLGMTGYWQKGIRSPGRMMRTKILRR